MPRPLKLQPLPENERRQSLTAYLDAIEREAELAHFRRHVPGGQERQLALFAALERAAFRGGPAACRPAIDDVADQLLCDLLEMIDRDPRLKNFGAAYGADRYKANLQALGAWSGQPRALELFTTSFSHLNTGAAGTLLSCEVNCSPDRQESRQSGELIAAPVAEKPGDLAIADGILHHGAQTPGEQSQETGDCNPEKGDCEERAFAVDCQGVTTGRGFEAAARAVRRGRPPALDDLAKGRLLGLMAHGLSFRQAAAQLGVHHVTVLNALKRDEAFAQQVAEARLDAISQPLLVVVQAARKNWRAAAWLAKFLNDRRTSGYERTPEERELECRRS